MICRKRPTKRTMMVMMMVPAAPVPLKEHSFSVLLFSSLFFINMQAERIQIYFPPSSSKRGKDERESVPAAAPENVCVWVSQTLNGSQSSDATSTNSLSQPEKREKRESGSPFFCSSLIPAEKTFFDQGRRRGGQCDQV